MVDVPSIRTLLPAGCALYLTASAASAVRSGRMPRASDKKNALTETFVNFIVPLFVFDLFDARDSPQFKRFLLQFDPLLLGNRFIRFDRQHSGIVAVAAGGGRLQFECAQVI